MLVETSEEVSWLDKAIAAGCGLTRVGACICIGVIGIIAAFLAVPDDSITTRSQLTSIGTGIGIDVIAIITGLEGQLDIVTTDQAGTDTLVADFVGGTGVSAGATMVAVIGQVAAEAGAIG